MLFIFPLIYITSFFVALREVIKGNTQCVFLFLIFGLSIYTTAMSVAFALGLRDLIPFFQVFKELLILGALILNLVRLKYMPRLHLIDYLVLAFLLYTLLYAVLPIGEQGFGARLGAFKGTSFFVVVYFTGRLMDIKDVYISKYFNYILLLTIAAGAILITELVFNTHLQTFTGFADYNYYFFNFEPTGSYGLTSTFESEGGYKRFASFFSTPIEHGTAAMMALCVIAALYTTDDNKVRLNRIGVYALAASALSIFFSISRAPLIGYLFIIYVYARITKRRYIVNSIHLLIGIGASYIIYLFTLGGDKNTGPVEVLMNTIDFSNPSSAGHLIEWVEGILSMIEKPFGLGLGSSGRVAGTLGEQVGGENQFIIIGVQVGIVAMAIYIWVYVLLIKKGLKWLPVLKGKERRVCMAILLIKIGLIVPLFTSEIEASAYISYLTWFLSGLFVSILMQPQITQTYSPVYDN